MSTPPWPPPPGGLQPAPGASGSGNGTLILVLGILSIICLPILGPVAWILGNNALASGAVDPSQAGSVSAGRICGMVGTALFVLGIIWFFFLGGLAIMGSHHAGGMPGPTP